MSIHVIDPAENSHVPFLRGILTRSLRMAGLSFAEAYDIANLVRERLKEEERLRTTAPVEPPQPGADDDPEVQTRKTSAAAAAAADAAANAAAAAASAASAAVGANPKAAAAAADAAANAAAAAAIAAASAASAVQPADKPRRAPRGPSSEITTGDLTQIVVETLQQTGYEDHVESYLAGPQLRAAILVRCREGRLTPFSRAHLARSLERCALPPEDCEALAAEVEQQIIGLDQEEIPSSVVIRHTYTMLQERAPAEISERYLAWLAFFQSERPLILLVGGTTGSGKSTFTAEVAHRLGIVRTQSTDMLREVMRYIPTRKKKKKKVPAILKASSFKAWKALSKKKRRGLSEEERVIVGYQAQARKVGVAVEGVIRRAEREQIMLILEGVHLHPALQRACMEHPEAAVTSVVLAVPKRKQLKDHLKGRGQHVPTRRAKRYLKHFDAIWTLQTYLLREAETYEIPIIPNVDTQETVRLFMEAISEQLTERHDTQAILDTLPALSP